MNNIYGYMDPDELVIEREYMENKNEFLRLFTEYEMAEKEHQLNMDDIELKSILMENCSLDDLQIMYEEEEKKDGEKKVGILQAIWNRIVKIFEAIIGKFDKMDPDKLSEEDKKKKLKLPKLNNLITGVDSLQKASSTVKNSADKYIDGDKFKEEDFLMDIGLKAALGITAITGLGVIGDKIQKDLENPDTETEVGPFMSKLVELRDKFKTAESDVKSTQSSLKDKASEGLQKAFEVISKIITPIAKFIDGAWNLVQKGIGWIKDKVTGNDKGEGNGTNGEDEPKHDSASFLGGLGELKKSFNNELKDFNPNGTITYGELDKILSSLNNLKTDDKEMKKKISDTISALNNLKTYKDSKNKKDDESVINERHEELYTSLFEALDIEHIDAEYESSNIDVYDDSTSEFISLLNTL